VSRSARASVVERSGDGDADGGLKELNVRPTQTEYTQ
jgi:hypothetical protein